MTARQDTQKQPIPQIGQILPNNIQRIDLKEAQRLWLNHRHRWNYRSATPLLTPPTGNYKFRKSADSVPIWGLSLAQAELSGIANLCPSSTIGCRTACLGYAGLNGLNEQQRARQCKTEFLIKEPEAFCTILYHEIEGVVRKQHAMQLPCAIRLNILSDIRWENVFPEVFDHNIQFFDYTKIGRRIGSTPPNYYLLYSASERTTQDIANRYLEQGHNVAVVFDIPKGEPLPKRFWGRHVIDGDINDARWLDPWAVIIGLRAKGNKTRLNNNKFVNNTGENK